MKIKQGILQVLKHDLHKLIPSAAAHKDALPDERMKRADGVSAWFSRNCLKEKFEDRPYRKSLIFQAQHSNHTRIVMNKYRGEIKNLFQETDPYKLHDLILSSRLLNIFNEAKEFPCTSLKYHSLIATSLFYNFQAEYKIKDLYLCENLSPKSPFQVIYKYGSRTWAICPDNKGFAKIYPSFYKTWERRKVLSFGGDYRVLDGILNSIRSWTCALATIDDFLELVNSL